MNPVILPLAYTGVRAEKFLPVKLQLEANGLDVNDPAVKKFIKEVNVEQRRAEAQAARRAAATVAKKAAKTAAETPVIDISRKGGFGPVWDETSLLLKRLANNLSKTIYAQVTVNGKVIKASLLEVTGGDGIAKFYNSIYRQLIAEYNDGNKEEAENILIDSGGPNDIVRLTVFNSSKIPTVRIRQKYREGILSHCVLDPILVKLQMRIDNCKTDGSKKELSKVLRRVEKLKTVYAEGVPEGIEMAYVAKTSGFCITIYDIIGNEVSRYNSKARNSIHFTNTRFDHLQEGMMTLTGSFENVTQEKLQEIMNKHDKEDKFYLIGAGGKSIRSMDGCWAVYNENHDAFQRFNDLIKLRQYGFDAVKYPMLYDFIYDGTTVHSVPVKLCDKPNDIEGCTNIDMTKAYTQHKNAMFYRGFVGHINHFAKLDGTENAATFLETHIGYFQFLVTACPDELLSILGIKVGEVYIKPSVEIEYFLKYGVEVHLLVGAWGTTFDFDYTPEMLENSIYQQWAGKLGQDRLNDCYTVKGDHLLAALFRRLLTSRYVEYFAPQKLIKITRPRDEFFTKRHIMGFITAYTRINLMEIMRSVKGELVKAVLDSVYFKGTCSTSVPHKLKELKHHDTYKPWYDPINTYNEYDTVPFRNKKLDIPTGCRPNIVALTGAGGTGKTHSILTDKTIINPLIVVPANNIGAAHTKQYGARYTTIHRLLGVQCRSYMELYGEPGVIFLDELTMSDKEWIESVFEMYKNTEIYIAGDVDKKQWYQCRTGYPGEFSSIWLVPSDVHMIDYNTDYRASESPELIRMKLEVREKMREIFADAFDNGGETDAGRIQSWVKKTYPTISFAEAMTKHQNGDIWLASTHLTHKRLTNAGIVSGWRMGDKSISEVEVDGAEKRGSFTVHAHQGLTIDSAKVFIVLDSFEYAMFYTALSRLRRIEQLVLVRHWREK